MREFKFKNSILSIITGEALKIHISPQCREYLVKLGGYVIEERGLVNMKGKGDVLTYWLISHTKGIVHRRESAPDDFLQVPTYPYSGSDIKKRSPNCVLPRKGSLVAFKNSKTDGSNLNISNISNSRLPAFLRLKAHDSMCSIRTNSPKQSRKILRQSRLLSRDQICDNEEHTNHLNHNSQTHSKLRNSFSFANKSSERLNTLTENNTFANLEDIKHESLTPLLSDEHHNQTNEIQDQNLLLDYDTNDGKYSRQSSEAPLISPKVKTVDFFLSKKWNSCTELGCDKTTPEKNEKSYDNSINRMTRVDPVAKNSLIGVLKPNNFLNEGIREDTVNTIVKRRASNCDFVIKSLTDCEARIESSV